MSFSLKHYWLSSPWSHTIHICTYVRNVHTYISTSTTVLVPIFRYVGVCGTGKLTNPYPIDGGCQAMMVGWLKLLKNESRVNYFTGGL